MTAAARHQSLGVHLCTITDHLPPGIRKALSHRSRKVLVARLALTPPFRAAFAHHEGLCSPGAAGLMGKPRRSAARASRLDGSNSAKRRGNSLRQAHLIWMGGGFLSRQMRHSPSSSSCSMCIAPAHPTVGPCVRRVLQVCSSSLFKSST